MICYHGIGKIFFSSICLPSHLIRRERSCILGKINFRDIQKFGDWLGLSRFELSGNPIWPAVSYFTYAEVMRLGCSLRRFSRVSTQKRNLNKKKRMIVKKLERLGLKLTLHCSWRNIHERWLSWKKVSKVILKTYQRPRVRDLHLGLDHIGCAFYKLLPGPEPKIETKGGT